MLSSCIRSSNVALLSFSNSLKCRAKDDAVVSPTSGIPRAFINVSNLGFLASSILAKRLSIDFSPKPSRFFNSDSCCFNLNRSATFFT